MIIAKDYYISLLKNSFQSSNRIFKHPLKRILFESMVSNVFTYRNRALPDPKSKQHRHIKTLAEKEVLVWLHR